MANEQIIDTIIDPKADAQVADLTKLLVDLDVQMTQNIKSANALNAATGNSRSFSDYTRNATAAALATERIQQAQNRTAQTAANLATAQNRLTTAQNTANASNDRAAASAAKATGEYQKLLRAYTDANTAARNAGAQFGVMSREFETTSAEARRLRGELDAIDHPLGNYQRNVGNYGSAFGKLGDIFGKAFGAIRTLANIIPNFGIGTFFLLLGEGVLALANKFELFNTRVSVAVSNLKNLNEVMKEADKQYGEQAVHLRVLYQAATDVNNNMHDRLLAVRELKKEFPDTFKNLKNEAILNGEASASYQQLTKDILANAKAKAVADKLADLEGKEADARFQKEKIQNAQNNEYSNHVLELQKRVQGGLEFNAKNYGKAAPTAADILASTQRILASGEDVVTKAINKRATDANKIQDQNLKDLQAQKDFLIKFAGGNNKIAKGLITGSPETDKKPKDDRKKVLDDQLKQEKEYLDQTLLRDDITLQDRLDAIDDFNKASNALIRGGIRQKVVTTIEGQNLLTQIDNDTVKIRLKTAKDAEKALADSLKAGAKMAEDDLKNTIQNLQEAGDTKLLELTKQKTDQELVLAQQYADGLITEKQYNQKKQEIDDKAAEDRIKQEIVTQQAIIDVRKALLEFGIGNARDLLKDEQKQSQNRINLVEAQTKTTLDKQKEIAQARIKEADLEKQLAEETANFIIETIDAAYQKRIDRINDTKAALEDQTKAEIEQVNNSILSEASKQKKINVINAQSAAQQKQLDADANRLKNQQAKFDRDISIARVIENTAIADSKALAEFPFPFNIGIAALITALGAVQIAKIAATPLPHYAKGGVTKGGALVWGEAGVELATEPGGRQYLSPNSATVANMPKGTKITPHLELMRMIKPDVGSYSGGESIGWKEVVKAIKDNKQDKPKNLIRVNINTGHEQYSKQYLRR